MRLLLAKILAVSSSIFTSHIFRPSIIKNNNLLFLIIQHNRCSDKEVDVAEKYVVEVLGDKNYINDYEQK